MENSLSLLDIVLWLVSPETAANTKNSSSVLSIIDRKSNEEIVIRNNQNNNIYLASIKRTINDEPFLEVKKNGSIRKFYLSVAETLKIEDFSSIK